MRVANVWRLVAVISVTAATHLAGQKADGLDLERRGLYEEALEAYRQVLDTDRTNVTAWLGLERVLGQMGRLDSLIPLIDTVLVELPDNGFVRELQLRAWSALGQLDSLEAAAVSWIEAAPESSAPYRQWAFALARRGDHDSAIRILESGRARLGPTSLAPELARMYVSIGDWRSATREWVTAVEANESYNLSAVAALRDAPVYDRESVLSPLTVSAASPAANRLGAELLVLWDRAEEGWTLLDTSLPDDRAQARLALERFSERTKRVGTEQASRARGFAMEKLAGLVDGAERERARLEAAQAYADAGDLIGARRMLERLAESPTATPTNAGDAMATVIRVTIELGRTEEAGQRFDEWQDRMSADDVEDLRGRLAGAWIGEGDLQRAEDVLAGDPSIGSLALLGWVRLYSGDLRSAAELFRAAGPYASSREEATRRTAMVALIQRMEPDSLPELGNSLLDLAQGDSARAIAGLTETADLVPADGGRAELLTLAGELALAFGDHASAEPLLLAALEADPEGPIAPAAEYALALLLSRTQRPDEAKARLEHLILSYTNSAVVPEARRLLDQLAGAIPKS